MSRENKKTFFLHIFKQLIVPFFFERCSHITATVCAYKLNNARKENLFAHTIAVMRLHLSKKNDPLLIFTFLKPILRRIINLF